MTTNPLAERKPVKGKGMPVTREQIEQLAASFNRSRFVIDYGWFYFVGETEDGKAELKRSNQVLTASVAQRLTH